MTRERIAASFRDPCGFIFKRDGLIFRQINPAGLDDYRHLLQSGLYEMLTGANLVIKHSEVAAENPENKSVAAGGPAQLIRPEQIQFISYPWEWSFSQLKDAALTTLAIQKAAIDRGMTLKDSSAFNIQFIDARPVLIDTLSFTRYQEGSPWAAYRQFCQHFLAPLALMSRVDVRLLQLFRVHLDGLPLDLTSRLLPVSTWLRFGLLTHIHLHARSQAYYADKSASPAAHSGGLSKNGMLGLIDSLESTVNALNMPSQRTEWGDYYSDTNYSDPALLNKRELVDAFIARSEASGPVWDLGANTGFFSRLACARGLQTVAFDIDPVAVDKNYRQCRQNHEKCLLPLLLDLTNPAPALGWENRERMSLAERGPADLIMALALVHHLAISNNLPLDMIAAFLARNCRRLIIEFVPKADSQVQRLLASRADIFPDYTQAGFEQAFSREFRILAVEKVRESERLLYLMEKA